MKALVKEMAPPALLKLYQRLKNGRPVPSFSGKYERFEDVPDEHPWDGEFWLATSKIKLHKALDLDREDMFSGPAWQSTLDSKIRASRNRSLSRYLPDGVRDYLILPCLIANQLSCESDCRILDFAGGTGYVYHMIKYGFTMTTRVSWHVVDSPMLTNMGKEYQDSMDRLSFSNDLPDQGFDLIYINTALQYVKWRETLGRLTQYSPKYFIFTRLLAGQIPTTVCVQRIGGRGTPCVFVDARELIRFFDEKGYAMEFKSPGESLIGEFAEDFPEDAKIPCEMNLVFSKKD